MKDLTPAPLREAIRSEALFLKSERRTRTFLVEYRLEDGEPIEARVRSHERLILVPLTT